MILGSRCPGGTYRCTLCIIPNGSRSGTVFRRLKHKHGRRNMSQMCAPADGSSSLTVRLDAATALNKSRGWGGVKTTGTSSCKCCSLSSDIGCSILHGPPTTSSSESGLFAVRLSGVRIRCSEIFSMRNCNPASPIASSLLQCSEPSITALCNYTYKKEKKHAIM